MYIAFLRKHVQEEQIYVQHFAKEGAIVKEVGV